MKRNDAIDRKWTRGIAAAILLLGLLLSAMIVVRPYGSPGWVWAFALLVYMPFVLVGTALFKWIVLLVRRRR